MSGKKINFKKMAVNGVWKQNPVLVQAIGLCPTLATTTSMKNGLYMGMATTFVLLGSNFMISALKKVIPSEVRIPIYIVIIATFVTLVQLFVSAFMPELNKSLGIFIPLIVVNCMVLGRAEAFASKNGILSSIIDAITMGAGFTFALLLMSGIREILGSNKFFDLLVIPNFQPISAMILPVGGFLTIGVLIGLMNYLTLRKKRKGKV